MTRFPLVLSAPSGAGKTSLVRRLMEIRDDLGFSVSATTRPQRAHEVEGTDYYFMSEAEFARRRDQGDLAEWAEVHGHSYGTPRTEITRILQAGKHVIMEIDVQGARAIRRAFPGAVLVFILPPSADALIERLRGRKTESADAITVRLRTALGELDAVWEYDYVVVNDSLETATSRISSIVDAEMVHTKRLKDTTGPMAALIDELRRGVSANVG